MDITVNPDSNRPLLIMETADGRRSVLRRFGGANRCKSYPQRPVGLSDGGQIIPQTTEVIPWGEAMYLWGEAMRLQVIPWGEAIKNY